MKRSQLKKQLKAKRAASRRDPEVRRGFRKIHYGAEVYLWRSHGNLVEIRTPFNAKWIVPIWQLQGHKTEEEWLKKHEDCCRDGCCDPCSEYWVQPKLVREYIDEMRKVTA